MPVVKNKYGTTYYNEKGEFHREDDPAIEWYDGFKLWCQNGKRHRVDGPAIECSNRDKYWYYQGEKKINCNSQSEYQRIIRLKCLW